MASGPRFLSGADLQGQIDQISSQIILLSNTMSSNHSIVTSQLSQLEIIATNASTLAQQASTAAQQAAQAATARATWWPEAEAPVSDARLQADPVIYMGGGMPGSDDDSLSKAAWGLGAG